MENRNFYFNEIENTYERVLDSFAATEVHSFKTSSIPLAEFWMPKNENLSKKILEKLEIEKDFDNAKKIFEYPVYSKCEGKIIGKPSMTDLMIITNDKQIAIEAKFTENHYEIIDKWLESKSDASKKSDVLNGWYEFIEKKLDIKYSDEELEKVNKNVEYQFLHRTASACSSDKKSVLVYQLFYDAFDEDSKNHHHKVAQNLQKFAKYYLKFKSNKSFYIAFTPVLNFRQIEKECSGQKSSLFVAMKKKDIYKFGIPLVVDCLEEDMELPELKYYESRYTNEEFIQNYKQLWEETLHRGEDQKSSYEKRIKAKYQNRLEKDAFNESESEKRYNKDADKDIDLNNDSNEEWRCLTNSGYTRYAVSSLGRVAFKNQEKYQIIKQDDVGKLGYLKLDPDGEYDYLDHNIEVYKLIAMGFLGKVVGDGYDVHHKINDGYNCRPENLVLLTRAQHNAVHSKEKIKDLKKYFNDFF